MTQITQQIPAGWKVKALAEICDILIGGTPSRNKPEYWDKSKEDKNVWISIRDLSKRGKYIADSSEYISNQGVKSSNVKLIPKGNVLMSFKLTIGRTAITDRGIYTNEAIAAFLVKDDSLLDSNFLYYALPGLQYDTDTAIKGATLNKEKLKTTDIILPSLSEQTKIATILSKVDKEIEKVEQIIEQTEKLKKGLMQKLLTKGIGHTKFKKTKLGEIPEEWEVVPLEKISSVDRGKFSHRPRNDKRFYGGNIPFIQTGDVVNSYGKITQYSQTLNDRGLAVSRMFETGTIVLTIAANIGDTGILTFDSCFPDSLVGIRVSQEMNNEFLEYFLRTKKPYLNKIATQSAQKNINLQKLRPLLIVKPPLREQKKIAGVLLSTEKQISINRNIKSNLQKLKKGLMSDLLSGRVRVVAQESKTFFCQWLSNFPNLIKDKEKRAIMKLLEDVKQVLQQEYDEILEGGDFDQNDKSIEKLEAMLAEWRSVIFLKNHNFIDIKLLPSNRKVKVPDILASFSSHSFAIEVKCLTKAHSRSKIQGIDAYSLDDDKLRNTLKTIAKSAKPQLDSKTSDNKMLIFVLNRGPDAELHTKQENKTIIEALANNLNWGKEYYFGFVSRNGLEDFVSPAFNLE